MLSRFLINLRQLDASQSTSRSNVHSSRISALNFRMPTADDVVGNLGEPLDFAEYRIDEDTTVEGAQCDAAQAEIANTVAKGSLDDPER